MEIKVSININRLITLFALIAWIATIIQGYNAIWGFWQYPVRTWIGYSNQVYSEFQNELWIASAFMTGAIAVVLTFLIGAGTSEEKIEEETKQSS